MARRDSLEKFVGRLCKPGRWELPQPGEIFKIFILRNNDIGDLILTTPLFEALKKLFPNCQLLVGIGDWNQEILNDNPHVDELVPLNAPWHNKVSCRHSPNSKVGFLRSLGYIFFSREARQLRRRDCQLGIDVLGSLEGTLLLHRANIPNRMGAKGYSGGYSGCQKWRQFHIDENAGRSTLRYAEILGTKPVSIPALKPQLYLSDKELQAGTTLWSNQPGRKKIIVSTGAGFPEKCWPVDKFKKLAEKLADRDDTELLFLGSKKDEADGEALANAIPRLLNLAGRTTLRETIAAVSCSDLVVCNTTMFMHVAAAFEVPTLVMLGPWYDSAQLHRDQWGHPCCTILGRETAQGRDRLATVQDAFEHCVQILGQATQVS